MKSEFGFTEWDRGSFDAFCECSNFQFRWIGYSHLRDVRDEQQHERLHQRLVSVPFVWEHYIQHNFEHWFPFLSVDPNSNESNTIHNENNTQFFKRKKRKIDNLNWIFCQKFMRKQITENFFKIPN